MAGVIRKVFLPSVVYCLACFVLSVVFYWVHLKLYPVPFQAPLKTWLASSLLMGVFTVFYCSGGLVGIWALIYSSTSQHKDHLKAALLIGAITSSLWIFGFTIGEDDRLGLGAIFVTCTTLVFAFVVKIYTPSKVV